MHHSTTRLCSSWLRVGLSPVVPTGTRPWVPSSICQFTRARNASSSTFPPLNGVTRAVIEPLSDFIGAFLVRGVASILVGRHISAAAHRRKQGFSRLPPEPVRVSLTVTVPQRDASAAGERWGTRRDLWRSLWRRWHSLPCLPF